MCGVIGKMSRSSGSEFLQIGVRSKKLLDGVSKCGGGLVLVSDTAWPDRIRQADTRITQRQQARAERIDRLQERVADRPEVRIALNQRSNVTVTLETPEALPNAEVRVELRGAVALDGYAGQRELRWSTNLDSGVNQLTLPVVASQASGGQVLVEVTHGVKRRTFVLDVRVG